MIPIHKNDSKRLCKWEQAKLNSKKCGNFLSGTLFRKERKREREREIQNK